MGEKQPGRIGHGGVRRVVCFQAVTEAAPPPELEMGDALRPRVSIFLNVFDVHVNRIPADGVITRMVYRPGKFFNASLSLREASQIVV